MSKKDGGPAFPREDYQTDDAPGQRGMSLRDYFAAQALPAALQQAFSMQDMPRHNIPSFAADCSYDIADAMIAASKR